jgi:hypothetical protein
LGLTAKSGWHKKRSSLSVNYAPYSDWLSLHEYIRMKIFQENCWAYYVYFASNKHRMWCAFKWAPIEEMLYIVSSEKSELSILIVYYCAKFFPFDNHPKKLVICPNKQKYKQPALGEHIHSQIYWSVQFLIFSRVWLCKFRLDFNSHILEKETIWSSRNKVHNLSQQTKEANTDNYKRPFILLLVFNLISEIRL